MSVTDAEQLEIQGGGGLDFAKFFLGGYLGLSKNVGGSSFSPIYHFYCFIALLFFMWQFVGPYNPGPPPPPRGGGVMKMFLKKFNN